MIPSGVYCIQNKTTLKRYIGSSKHIKNRLTGHKRSLEQGKHHSVLLQRAWDKYGKICFDFLVIEDCLPETLIEREQFWMDYFKSYDSKNGYNIKPLARGGGLCG